MSMLSEFREFALKGNVVDLAVGVIIARPSGPRVVRSLTTSSCRHRPPSPAAWISPIFSPAPPGGHGGDAGKLRGNKAPCFAYGKFLTAVLKFSIVAFVLFFIINKP